MRTEEVRLGTQDAWRARDEQSERARRARAGARSNPTQAVFIPITPSKTDYTGKETLNIETNGGSHGFLEKKLSLRA